MASLDDVGTRDGWRCWVCDLPVAPDASVNDDRGPSIDRFSFTATGSKGAKREPDERLAHRQCNTKKGAIRPVIAWPDDVVMFDPAPILQTVERLATKGGRELVVRCAQRSDADALATWLVDRLSRLVPRTSFDASVNEGGGQFLVALTVPRR
jgi:hypothetical protein